MKVKESQASHDDSPDDSHDDSLDDSHDDSTKGAFDVAALVDSHPVATLLGALGVGYVLGGGLFTSLTRRLFGTGLRLGFQLAVLPALERQVAGMAGDLGKTLGNLGVTKDVTKDGSPRQ
jgi:hypothetical protein